jgi:hypothetical protein
MNDIEASEEEIKKFMESVTWRRLLYLWTLRANGLQVNDEEIRKLEAEVYPELQEFIGKTEHQLCQRDVDELQLLLSLVEPQANNGESFTKALLFRLCDTTVRMRKENNHQRPHFHIEYKNQYSASYAVDTLERLAGNVPSKYEKPILEWAAQNRKSLNLTWDKLQAGENIRELVSAANTA